MVYRIVRAQVGSAVKAMRSKGIFKRLANGSHRDSLAAKQVPAHVRDVSEESVYPSNVFNPHYF